MTPADDVGFAKAVFDYAWGIVLALLGLVWKMNGAAMKSHKEQAAAALQAHKDEDHGKFTALHEEQVMQRSHIAKLFDKLEQRDLRAEARHLELLTTIHNGLAGKADK